MELVAARVHSALFSLRTNRPKFRILVELLLLVSSDTLRDSLVAEYEKRMNHKENHWTLVMCCEDIDIRKKEYLSYIDVVLDALPEYQNKDTQGLFQNLLLGIESAKMSLEMKYGDRKFVSLD